MTTSGRWAHGSREDELLSRFYQQLTELQAPRFGGRYDIVAGQDRYQAWLREHTAKDEAAVSAGTLGPLLADRGGVGLGGARLETAVPGASEKLAAFATGPGPGGKDGADQRVWAADADSAVATLYRVHYRSLVRLAALLTEDIAAAEEIVQDSFVALHVAWPGLLSSDQALAYLRRTVVNQCRLLQRRPIVTRNAPRLPSGKSRADHPTAWLERSAAVAALRALPPRQREALVLRYYSELSESQVVEAMGISKGAVRIYTARAMSSLRAVLEKQDDESAPLNSRHQTPPDSSTPEWPTPDGHRYA